MRETLPPAAVAFAAMIEAPSKRVSRISDSGYYRKLCRMNARSPSFGFSAHLSGKSAMNRWILPPGATIYANGDLSFRPGLVKLAGAHGWRQLMGMRGVVSFGPFRLFAAERQLKKGDEPLQLGSRTLTR